MIEIVYWEKIKYLKVCVFKLERCKVLEKIRKCRKLVYLQANNMSYGFDIFHHIGGNVPSVLHSNFDLGGIICWMKIRKC